MQSWIQANVKSSFICIAIDMDINFHTDNKILKGLNETLKVMSNLPETFTKCLRRKGKFEIWKCFLIWFLRNIKKCNLETAF